MIRIVLSGDVEEVSILGADQPTELAIEYDGVVDVLTVDAGILSSIGYPKKVLDIPNEVA